jgi:hypothetical protein
MASSRRSTHSHDEAAEPFPAFSGLDENTTSVTTSTTTQMVIGGDGDPDIRTTTTAAHPTGATPSAVHTTTDPNTAPVPFSRTVVSVGGPPAQPAVPNVVRQRPIGIRRLPSAQSNRLSAASGDSDGPSRSNSGRRRATSAPQDPHHGLTRQSTRQSALPPLQEESAPYLRVPGQAGDEAAPPVTAATVAGVGRRRSLSNAARSIRSKLSTENESTRVHDDYEDEVVDLLDVIGMYMSSPPPFRH